MVNTVHSAIKSAGENGYASPQGRMIESDVFTPMRSSATTPGNGLGVPPTPIQPRDSTSQSSVSDTLFSGARTPSPNKNRSVSPDASVSSRASSATDQIIARSKSKKNLLSDEGKASKIERILNKNKADPFRLSEDIGKTLGVPNTKGLIGKAPIRSAISRHQDSRVNLIHLRVATPADPPDKPSISLLKVSRFTLMTLPFNLNPILRLILIEEKKGNG
jgi:hypothetical protein